MSSARRVWLGLLAAALFSAGSVAAQTITLGRAQVDVAVAAGINPLPMRVPVTVTGAALASVTVTSDASWVTGGIDAQSSEIVLTFAAASLLQSSYTANLTVSTGAASAALSVRVTLAALNVKRLKDDPRRSLTYALHQNGTGVGALVLFDPLAGTYLGSVTVGARPTTMAINSDATEMLVLCSSAKTVVVVDLVARVVRQTIVLPNYTEWDSSTTAPITLGRVDYGPGDVFYYVDSTWAPTLRVYDRASGTVLQQLQFDSSYGFGEFAVNPARTALFACGQYGWSAGSSGSQVARFSINANGTLTLSQMGALTYPIIQRDPFESPVQISSDGTKVLIKQHLFAADNLLQIHQSIPAANYAMSPGGEVAATSTALHRLSDGQQLHAFGATRTVQTITSDYARLVYFDSALRELRTINLPATVGMEALGLTISPAANSVVISPSSLQWTPQAGVDRYRVYFGSSETAVRNANTLSAEYLGEVSAASINLGQTMPAGTYFWRVDALAGSDVSPGEIFQFTVASIGLSMPKIDTATVHGHDRHRVSVGLSSMIAGKSWSATSAAPWVTVVNASGVTPANLEVQFRTSELAAGVHATQVTLHTDEGDLQIPVQLRVDPLALTVMRSRPGTTKVFAISEETSSSSNASARAYFLEIDTLFRRIERVVPVGSSAVDFALHVPENRIYISNWRLGQIIALNLATLEFERTYGVAVPGSSSIYGQDAFRLAAGAAGRLMVEGQDQWVQVGLLNTVSGQRVASLNLREGGGVFAPNNRYYFHGDNNSSGAALRKIDTAGDVLSEVKSVRGAVVSYYGSRLVVMSEDGSRVFWSGLMHSPDLDILWALPEEIRSVSADGRYAFGSTGIFDTVAQVKLGNLPTTVSVQAFNSAMGLLVYPRDGALEFLRPAGVDLLGDALPANGAIVAPTSLLTWPAITGATGYRVYLGTDAEAVASAQPGSDEDRGAVAGTSLTLPQALAAGQTYFWRVDVIVGSETAPGAVRTFKVSQAVPSLVALDEGTIAGFADHQVTLTITASSPWTAATEQAWIKLTPNGSTLRVTLDAAELTAGDYTGSVTLTVDGSSVAVPVKLRVDALNVTVFRSDAASSTVYAISENTTAPTRAYLLQLDAATEQIVRVIKAGSGVTDLSIHVPEQRVYVAHNAEGKLRAYARTDLSLVRAYDFKPFAGIGYSDYDVFRAIPGQAGRMVIEPRDQWVYLQIYDTVNAARLATLHVGAGGGAFDPTRRYYYHGEANSSGASLLKLDVVGDKFTNLKSARVTAYNYYGARTVVVSDDGQKIFWNGGVFDADLNVLWTYADEVQSVSSDGRYAFGRTTVVDTVAQKPVMAMPVTTAISAFNSTAGKLVVQQGGRVMFYAFDPAAPMAAPTLSLGTIGSTNVQLNWTDATLETGFFVQKRASGEADWSDVPALGANVTTVNVTGLTHSTRYEFRVRAEAGDRVSAWSNIVEVTTTSPPPSTPALNTPVALDSHSVRLTWSVSGAWDNVVIERRLNFDGVFEVIAEVPFGTTEYTDTGLQMQQLYYYRAKAVRSGASSAYSTLRSVQTPQPSVAPAISVPPVDLYVSATNSVMFSVGVSGGPTLFYQWRRNGTPIPGATQSYLAIYAAHLGHAGTYDVTVWNSAGTVTSAPATLTVFRLNQSLTFAALANRDFTPNPITLDASTSSGLPVQFSVVSGPASIVGQQLTIEGSGTITVRAEQPGDLYFNPAATVTRSFEVAMSYAAWTHARFAAAERALNAVSGPLADPDRDGICNLMEYALSRDPNQPDTSGVGELDSTETHWSFTYARAANRTDVVYGVEVSADLQNWTVQDVVHAKLGEQDGVQVWQATRPRTTAPLFFRLRVTPLNF